MVISLHGRPPKQQPFHRCAFSHWTPGARSVFVTARESTQAVSKSLHYLFSDMQKEVMSD
jgi:hypothetical protein